LAYTHYPQSYLRERCDTDILFPDQAAFDKAWALLGRLGFERRNTLSGEFVGYQHCCYRPLEKGFHQSLDCHTRVNDYLFFADAFSFDELLKHSVPVTGLAESARTLGPVHALLLACMHRVATIPFGSADRLIWLYDIYLLCHSLDSSQWAEVLELARSRKLCATCVHSLDAAEAYFPLDVPADVMAGLEQAAQAEPFQPGCDMKRWQFYFHVLKTTPGLRGKARLLREHFFPSAEYMFEKYQTGSRLKLPFLYVHRVLSGFKRYF